MKSPRGGGVRATRPPRRTRGISRKRAQEILRRVSLLGMLRMLYDKLYLRGAVLRRFETGVTAKEAAYPSGAPQCTPAASGSLGGHRSRPRSGGHTPIWYTHTHTYKKTEKRPEVLFSLSLSSSLCRAIVRGVRAGANCCLARTQSRT